MAMFDITPDPKVLIALTHTPMQPLDALCELIDNAIDSFQMADVIGFQIHKPMIVVNLPTLKELERGTGQLVVRDNGPGMTAEQAEKAIRAGFSGNNQYDTLGLFGMGFNISTGKLGRVTKLFTAQSADAEALEVTIDLDAIRLSRSYKVPVSQVPKSATFQQGTQLTISEWWPEGNANGGFIKKLVRYGMPKVREEVGRRYATILRKGKIRIMINGEACPPFEHCVWADNRFVEHRTFGKIYAVRHVNELLGVQTRCTNCTALVPPGMNECPACHGSGLRTIEERVTGWVGIQRFDSETEFGIDLIRNGRAIKVGEKAAFFEFTDEFKHTVKDYPIDGPYGRIVGEIHLNHVPVDFLKQDFQRASPEWQRSITFLRGDSSLQPKKEGAADNNSSIFMLYQGFRRVRDIGKKDMYMGYWTPEGPKRISRDVEREYYAKFLQRLPGFFDDPEWWKLVEHADLKPVEEFIQCPSCLADNLKGQDRCTVCEEVLIPKTCINPDCGAQIAQSAEFCDQCGTSQRPTPEEEWRCEICGTKNAASRQVCLSCGAPEGVENPTSPAYLRGHGYKSDDLSIPNCSILLANGDYSQPADVTTYVTQGAIQPYGSNNSLPLLTVKGERIEVFVDLGHPAFKSFGLKPEQMIAAEVALYLYDKYRSLAGERYQGQHSLSNLEFSVLQARWTDRLQDSEERVRSDAEALFVLLRERLVVHGASVAAEIFEQMTDEEKRHLVDNLLSRGEDLGQIGKLKETGAFLADVSEETVVSIFRRYPEIFFDGRIWEHAYAAVATIPQVQQRIVATHLNCLEDVAAFIRYRSTEPLAVQRARASIEFLNKKLV